MARKRLVPGASAIYLMNEGSGTTLTDYSGSGNHGTLGSTAGDDTHDPAWGATGLTFVADDYVTLPTLFTDVAGKTGLTVMVVASLAGGTGYRPLIASVTTSVNTIGFNLWATHDTPNPAFDNLQFNVFSGIGGGNRTVNAPGRLAATPECVIARFIGGTSVQVRKGHTAWTTTTTSVPAAVNPTPSAVPTLGREGALYFAGTICCAIVYPAALTDTQIAQNYAAIKAVMSARGVVLP